MATDENGEVTQTLDYYPYGSHKINSGPSNEQRRFIGEEYDGDTDFSYLNARYYQGSRGQFMSQDPVFVNLGIDKRTPQILNDPQLLHSYSYSRNNPLIIKDDNGDFPSVIIGAGGAMAGQYIYDVYQNIQSDGLSASAFYSGLSSRGTYLTRAGQGIVLTATGGLVGGTSWGLLSQMGAMGVSGSAVGAGGNYILGDQVTGQSLITDAIFSAGTFGVASFIPGIRGARPNFGTPKFMGGALTVRHAQDLVVDAGSDHFNALIGGAPIGIPTRTFRYDRSGGASAGSASSFGLSGDTQISADNVGAFVSFISQFLN